MSSERVPPPALPVVWRPRKGRIVAYGLAALLMVGAVVMAVFLPPPFKLPDKIGVILFAGLVAWVLHLLGRCRVEADERGITLVNALRVHRYEWPEVLSVTLVEGEPWAKIDFSDGMTIGAMGLQGSEKARTAYQVMELAALIHERGEADEVR
ncbi:PH domain-containing protein [Planomonospora sp. ID67723]|uniref:PH domain-containing protein n=1 Tax=Planomonospora sp. ID67723 TaxID=2738134 RepID=UPI0018C397E1|nr:PH domain-containing protein [Planomonospora sp. ID67723]MBG0829487.1 PH domain-containing protein [Planomonospora sp. ID67723]